MLIFLVLLALGTCLSAASLDLQDHVARHDSPNPPTLPVTLTPAFTIDLNLAPFPPSNANLAPVLNGTISGPLLNGTVVSGLGYGQRFSTYYVTDALNYGFTDDGEEFVIHQSGSGNSTYGQLIKIVSCHFFFLFLSPFRS